MKKGYRIDDQLIESLENQAMLSKITCEGELPREGLRACDVAHEQRVEHEKIRDSVSFPTCRNLNVLPALERLSSHRTDRIRCSGPLGGARCVDGEY